MGSLELTVEHWSFDGICYPSFGDVRTAYFERHGTTEGIGLDPDVRWCDCFDVGEDDE